MLWAVYCKNIANASELRSQFRESHMAYLDSCPLTILMGGPLMAEDDQSVHGSFILFEAGSREAVEDVVFQDPFFTSGLWESVEIHAFRIVRSSLEIMESAKKKEANT